jgi:Lrp/AsnC family transcriptional regulator, leucine-responsive regulatory protein
MMGMSKKLDDIDRLMIALLRENARTPLVTLAKRVGLSRSAAQERLSRLESSGVIARYTIQFGEREASTATAWIMIRFVSGYRCSQVVPQILQNAEVRLCHSLAGPIDLLVFAEYDSRLDLMTFRERLAAIEGVAEVQTAPMLASHYG